jgi:hypothetical protein
MHKIDRRKALAVVAAAPAAVVLGSGGALANRDKDRLLDLIRRYNAELAALNAARDIEDEEVDAWMDRADAILIEAVGLPVLTAASAVAVIDLFVEQHWLTQHCDYGDDFLALVKNARNYIAAQGGDLGA